MFFLFIYFDVSSIWIMFWLIRWVKVLLEIIRKVPLSNSAVFQRFLGKMHIKSHQPKAFWYLCQWAKAVKTGRAYGVERMGLSVWGRAYGVEVFIHIVYRLDITKIGKQIYSCMLRLAFFSNFNIWLTKILDPSVKIPIFCFKFVPS